MIYKIFFSIALLLAFTQCRKKSFQHTDIVGHGGSGLSNAAAPYHDNSREAIDYALQTDGVAGVEVDVQCSADGTAWLFHDPELDDQTNGSGCINSLPDSYLETLKYSSLKGEKLARLSDLNFPFGVKDLYLDIRTLDVCTGISIQKETVIAAISNALSGVASEKINIILLDKSWIAAFSAQGWNVFYEPSAVDGYMSLEPNRLSQTSGVCLRNENVTADQVRSIQDLGKKVIIFEIRAPKAIRRALKKGVDVMLTDDLKNALIEKY